jgi:transcription initiation factor IIF auxiliary subunit
VSGEQSRILNAKPAAAVTPKTAIKSRTFAKLLSAARRRCSHQVRAIELYHASVVLIVALEHLGSDGKTHKWMVYVRGRKETSDVSKFIQKVRFFLHPTYAPDDIVEVRAPPFQITRRGNGHPVRLQIYLADGKTAPVHVVHALRLDFTTIGLQKMGTEQEVIIELDPEFCDRLDQESNSENTHTPEHYPLTGHKRRLEDDTEEGRRKRQKITDNDVGSFLKIEAEMRFPLVSEEKSGKLPFSCAKTAEQWNSWSLGKRKSSEWQRARRLRIRLEEELNINQTGLWTTKRIATFLRESGMTPPCKTQGNYDEMYQQQLIQYEQMKLRKATKKTLAKKIVFCQFCGCAHFPVDQFDELERRCGERKKVLLQSNLSSFAELNARSSAPLQPLTLVPPPRLLAPIAAQSKTGHVVLTTGANQQRQLVYISTGPLSQQQQNALMLKNHVVAVPAKPSQSSTGPRPIASAGQLPNIAPKPVLVQALNNNVVPSNAILVASDGAQMTPIAVHSEDKEKKTEAPHVHDNKSTIPEHSAATPLAIPVTTATPGTLVNIPNTNATPVNNTNTTPSNTVNTITPTIPTTNTNTNFNAATLSPNIARPTQPSPGAVTHVNGMPVHANNIVQVKIPHGTTNAVALPPGAVKVPVSVPGVVAVPAHHAVPVPDKLIHSTPVLSDNEAAWIRTVLGEIGVQVDEDSNKQVESVLFKAMMMFTQSLLHECQSVFINERNQDQATEKPFKVMVPNHVLTAILQNKNFDFLTNHGLQRKD